MTAGYDLAALVAVFTAACAVTDYRTKKIPNWLTVPAAVLGLAYHTLAPSGSGTLWALAGFAVGFVLLLLPWILGGGGMGDVKLLAALGAWLGPLYILLAFGCGTLLAAFMMIGIMVLSMFSTGLSTTQRRYLNKGGSTTATGSRKYNRVIPFAIPIALGTWLVLAWMLIRASQGNV